MSHTRRCVMQMSASLACGAWLGPGWPAEAETRDDWSADVAILRGAWQSLHPGLYRYSTPDQISARLDGLAQAWAMPGRFDERLLALTRVTASLKCGHTYPSPYNGGEGVVARMYPGRTLVPFRFRWLNRRMVVTRDESGLSLFPPGTEIVAIDGTRTTDLLARLIPLARADGSNDGKRISLMEVRGDDDYETFDIHLPLILPLAEEAAFTLTDERVVRAGLLTLTERQAGRIAAAEGAKDDNPWTIDHGSDGIARLTMPGWALYNSGFAWEAWLGQAMDDLTGDGVRGLIIDLRGNEGGLDCGNVIISRLIARDLPLSRDQRWVRYRRAPEKLHPYLDTWDKSFLDWGERAVPSDERPGFLRLTRSDDGAEQTVIRPSGRLYTGGVAVLCDASNSSATFGFCQSVKDNSLATLIGQTTGGNRRGINGGAFFFLKLPVSGLVLDLPLIASFPATPQPDAAIQPHVFVPTHAADISAGRDPQMEAATRWLMQRPR